LTSVLFFLQITEDSGNHKYKANSLRFCYNAISDLQFFSSTLEHFLENPLELAWLDLSFNDISTIDEVTVTLRGSLHGPFHLKGNFFPKQVHTRDPVKRCMHVCC